MRPGPLGSRTEIPPENPFHLAGRKPSGSRTSSIRRQRKEPVAPATTRVFIFGRLRELALYRAEVLRNRGFSVIVPATKAEAIAAIEQAEFDVAVLTYTLSNETVQELSELLRQRCPTCPLITITENHHIDEKVRPDRIVLANEGPEALLKALRHVMRPQ